MDPRQQLGQGAEDQAVVHLERAGYRIAERNARLRLGELDIVAWQGETLVFVEVRSRSRPDQVHPAETITRKKQRTIVRCAQAWIQNNRIAASTMVRFDVICCLLDRDRIEHYENAFEAGS